MNAREHALAILLITDPTEKAAQTRTLFTGLKLESIDPTQHLNDPGNLPGRPTQPALLSAREVPSKSAFTTQGRASLLHAIAHIEFNAINLALDAAFRFSNMPTAFYTDWLRVASEEALHFGLLREHLQSLGFDYGHFNAHDGLWQMAHRTQNDVLARMALVPRTLEARGLDATPPLQAKFAKAGDQRAVEILEIILQDEIGHVAIGNTWYRWCCQQEKLDPIAYYAVLTERYEAPKLRPPFNWPAREAAGFTVEELAFFNLVSLNPGFNLDPAVDR
jgi:uncharacterized ferritin-like protein (DUF455 family)